jgi:thioredoxin reductase (NADPH)
VVPQGREPAVDPTAPTTASTRSKPAILAVDDAGPVLAAVVRDLRRRYAARFRILPTSDSLAALSTLEELALAEDPVALIVADQRMPALSGTDLLTQVADSAPRRPRRPADRVHRHRRDRGDQQDPPRPVHPQPWDPPEEAESHRLREFLARKPGAVPMA